MQEKSKNNVILLVIAAIALIFIVIFILFMLLNNNLGVDNVDLENAFSDSSLKLDKNKTLVYDADYKLGTTKKSYSVAGKKVKAKDLIVPYINIDSTIAFDINAQIYLLYEELISKFNEYSKNKSHYMLVDYDVYINGNVLSVVITTVFGGISLPVNNYYIYNLNLDNGDLVSYKEAYGILGFNEEGINEKINNLIDSKMKADFSSVEDIDECITDTINNYKKLVKDNEIKFYIDKNKELNVIIPFLVPIEDGIFDMFIKIK